MPSPTRVLRASWSSTLCLPKSTFPPRPVVADRAKYLKRCTDDLYARNARQTTPEPPFVLHDGPPYANGSLHIGHALNKILKDIILRVKLAEGRNVRYTPGWDCHGLPIEVKALQQYQKEHGSAKTLTGEDGNEQNAVVIRQLARSLARRTVEAQRANFREWAVMGDWANAWTTMDKDFEMMQLEVFKQMLSKGLIYRKFKPVYWSPSSRSALAEAELEYTPDHVSTSAFVKFEASTQGALQSLFGIKGVKDAKIGFLIWTTTPWTLPANRAIAVHQELEYCCAYIEPHGYLIVEQSRLQEVAKACDSAVSEVSIQGSVLGKQLIGLDYRNDAFFPGQIGQVFHADFVSADSGTGLVHVAPGHGMDDYKLCLENGVEPFAPLDDLGRFTDEVLDRNCFADELGIIGSAVLGDGSAKIIKWLSDTTKSTTKSVQIIGVHRYTHNYPYDWRSKKPVVVRATAQWFADVGEIRQLTLAAIDNVNFIPAAGKQRLSSFIQNRSEWCISRQRAWGVPIPALYRQDDGEPLLTPDSVTHIISVIQERGIDAWWTDAPDEKAWIPPAYRGSGAYDRGRDTMDVWFDSGTSWTQMGKSENGFESKFADVYLEGSDQHRGWFQSSLLTKIAYDTATSKSATSPYQNLITHGFTLDSTGKKMSKSLGNVISPAEIMDGTLLPPIKRKGKAKRDDKQGPAYDALGPDALRMWVASSDYTKDVVVGESVLQTVNGSLNKLRTTFKMLTGLLADFPHQSCSQPLDALSLNNVVALVHLTDLSQVVWEAFANHEHQRAITAINHYINADFSAFYVESIKDTMYTDQIDSKKRRDAQFVLWHVFEELCSMLRPVIPLLVEEARAYMPQFQATNLSITPQRLLPSEDMVHGPGPVFAIPEERIEGTREMMSILDRIGPVIKACQEKHRAAKRMGSSLQSHVLLAPLEPSPQAEEGRALLQKLASIPDAEVSLADYYVVSRLVLDVDGAQLQKRLATSSSLSVEPDSVFELSKAGASWSNVARPSGRASGIGVVVYEPTEHKCERCWKYTVREEAQALCQRCEDVVGRNEPRSS